MRSATTTGHRADAPQPSGATSDPAPPARRPRLYELDLLRFLAAMAVVLFHYTFLAGTEKHGGPQFQPVDSYTRFGYLGVEFFFMLSGFVILMSAGGTSVRRFAVNRAIRLYPAYWIGIAATSTVVAVAGTGYSLQRIAANVTMLHPMVGQDSIDGVYWSLIVEFRFYVLVAAVIGLGLLKHIESLLAGWLIYAVLRLTLDLPEVLDLALLGQYSHYFIAGATFYLIWDQKKVTAQRIVMLLGSFALAMGYVASYATTLSTGYGVPFRPIAAQAIVASFFIVLAFISTTGIPALRRRSFLTLGAITYPIYLLHQVIGYAVYDAWAGPKWLMLATLTLGMVVVSHQIARRIEGPLSRAIKSRVPDSW